MAEQPASAAGAGPSLDPQLAHPHQEALTAGAANIQVAPLEPEADDDTDADSALGDSDTESSTASLSTSIMDYRTFHGRSYHSSKHETQYWGPNDDRQNEAMDINHHFLTLSLGGKLHLSPLKKDITKALDVGCGTGIWAIDFADAYPGCEVIGTDLSPIQPLWAPVNLNFEIDDAEQEWTFAPDSFDFINIRYMLGSIQDWPRLFKQAYAALKPGGYLESYESDPDFLSDDGTVRADSAMQTWTRLFTDGGKKLGRPFTVLRDNLQVKSMEEAGFENITVKNIKAPVGGWALDPNLQQVGQYSQLALEQDLEGYVNFMWNIAMDRPIDEMHIFLMAFRKELRTRSIHSYVPQRVVYAQKPMVV